MHIIQIQSDACIGPVGQVALELKLLCTALRYYTILISRLCYILAIILIVVIIAFLINSSNNSYSNNTHSDSAAHSP